MKMKNFGIQKYFGSDDVFWGDPMNSVYEKVSEQPQLPEGYVMATLIEKNGIKIPKVRGIEGSVKEWEFRDAYKTILISRADLERVKSGGYADVRDRIYELQNVQQSQPLEDFSDINAGALWKFFGFENNKANSASIWSTEKVDNSFQNNSENHTSFENNFTNQTAKNNDAEELPNNIISEKISPILRDNKLLKSELRIIEQAVTEKRKWLLENFLQENNILFEDIISELQSRLNRPSENGKKYVRHLLRELEK